MVFIKFFLKAFIKTIDVSLRMEYLSLLKEAAQEAGDRIQTIQKTDFEVLTKEDESPVTYADVEADEIIQEYLETTNIPILSEETEDDPERLESDEVWIIDPIDGTKEFVKKEDDFTVNIALIRDENPVLGVVYAPNHGKMYTAKKDKAWLNGERIACSTKNELKDMIFLASNSHHEKPVKDFLNRNDVKEVMRRGSSLKGCLVAEGKADMYLRLTPQSEWDIAAMHAVINGSGGSLEGVGEEICYNKRRPRVKNYICAGNKKIIDYCKKYYERYREEIEEFMKRRKRF